MTKYVSIDTNKSIVIDRSSSAASLHQITEDNNAKQFNIYYEAGTLADRQAKIIDTGNNKKALLLDVRNAAIVDPIWGTLKGRAQLHSDIYSSSMNEYKRIAFLSPISSFKTYPNGKIILGDLWIGHPWQGDTYASVITTSIRSYNDNMYFMFYMASQNTPEHEGKWLGYSWIAPIKDYPIILNEWIELYTLYRMNNEDQGRFIVYMRYKNQDWKILCDVTDYMYNPESSVPLPAKNSTICKVYTKGPVLNHIKNAGGSCRVIWDNINIWTNLDE